MFLANLWPIIVVKGLSLSKGLKGHQNRFRNPQAAPQRSYTSTLVSEKVRKQVKQRKTNI